MCELKKCVDIEIITSAKLSIRVNERIIIENYNNIAYVIANWEMKQSNNMCSMVGLEY